MSKETNAIAAAVETPKEVTRTDNSANVPLDNPIVRGEQKIESITLRKPKAGELRGVQLATLMAMDVGALQTVLPRISSPTLTTQDVAALDPADILALGMEVVGFFMTRAEKESLPA